MSQIRQRLDRLEQQIGTGEKSARYFRVLGGSRDSDVRGFLYGLGHNTTDDDVIVHLVLVTADNGTISTEQPETPLALLSYNERAA